MNNCEDRAKNLGESIRQKLKNLSRERGRPFDEILRYYSMERFLYRLSISPYVDRFFLKGGLILKILNEADHRPTMDIDLLARTSNQTANLKQVVKEICAIECEEDAISFDVSNLLLRESQIRAEYRGINVRFLSHLFTARIPVQIDIGFNDVMVPDAEEILYPALISMPRPRLFGYRFETVIAEKLETIVRFDLVNTRMKDFYDIWSILTRHKINRSDLIKAVKATFENRGALLRQPLAFTAQFHSHPETWAKWNEFLFAMGCDKIEFKEVVEVISDRLDFLFE